RPSSRPAALWPSELQPPFTGAFGEGLHPAVVLVPAAVEHDRLDALLARPGREQPARGARVLDAPVLAGLRPELAQALLERGEPDQRARRVVVDELTLDVPQRAVDDQPRPLGGAPHLL